MLSFVMQTFAEAASRYESWLCVVSSGQGTSCSLKVTVQSNKTIGHSATHVSQHSHSLRIWARLCGYRPQGQIDDIKSENKPVEPDFVLDGTLRNRKLFDASYTDCNDIIWCDDCCLRKIQNWIISSLRFYVCSNYFLVFAFCTLQSCAVQSIYQSIFWTSFSLPFWLTKTWQD